MFTYFFNCFIFSFIEDYFILFKQVTSFCISLDSVIFYDKPPANPYIEQIIYELNDCTDEEKDLALHTLRGLLDGLRKQK